MGWFTFWRSLALSTESRERLEGLHRTYITEVLILIWNPSHMTDRQQADKVPFPFSFSSPPSPSPPSSSPSSTPSPSFLLCLGSKPWKVTWHSYFKISKDSEVLWKSRTVLYIRKNSSRTLDCRSLDRRDYNELYVCTEDLTVNSYLVKVCLCCCSGSGKH